MHRKMCFLWIALGLIFSFSLIGSASAYWDPDRNELGPSHDTSFKFLYPDFVYGDAIELSVGRPYSGGATPSHCAALVEFDFTDLPTGITRMRFTATVLMLAFSPFTLRIFGFPDLAWNETTTSLLNCPINIYALWGNASIPGNLTEVEIRESHQTVEFEFQNDEWAHSSTYSLLLVGDNESTGGCLFVARDNPDARDRESPPHFVLDFPGSWLTNSVLFAGGALGICVVVVAVEGRNYKRQRDAAHGGMGAQATCPKCGNPLKGAVNFCIECGARVDKVRRGGIPPRGTAMPDPRDFGGFKRRPAVRDMKVGDIRQGLVGLGPLGMSLLFPPIGQGHISAVYDPNPHNWEAALADPRMRQDYGDHPPKYYQSFEAFLRDPEVHMITITVLGPEADQMFSRLMAAGKLAMYSVDDRDYDRLRRGGI